MQVSLTYQLPRSVLFGHKRVPRPWLALRSHCPSRSATTPTQPCASDLYRCFKRRLRHSLKRAHYNRKLVPVKKQVSLTYQLPRTKGLVFFLALKEFQDLCSDNIVLIATGNTTVFAYINKEGDMRSATLCALLWRILTWSSRNQLILKAWHIPGHLNVVADKLSILGQTIQTEWSLLPEIFQLICSRWHQPQIDLLATRFSNKMPQFMSPVPDSLTRAVDELSLPCEDLDPYPFPPVALLGKVVAKLMDYLCRRIILIAPEWSNMPRFCYLVARSHCAYPTCPIH